jgi:hypothetical protein
MMDSEKLRKEKHTERQQRSASVLFLAGHLGAGVLGGLGRRTAGKGQQGWKRLIAVVGSVVAVSMVASFAAAVTFGFFDATTTAQTSKLSAGTVTLTSDTSGACNVANMLPGSSETCALKVTYSGTVPAYLGLDVLIATKPGSPGTLPLYDPNDVTNSDLQVTVVDNQSTTVTYVQPSTSFGQPLSTCPGQYSSGSYTCYQLSDLLASTSPFTNNTSGSPSDVFTTFVIVPTSSLSGYQGGTASVVLLAHAVQAANQSLGSCSAGSPCSSIKWS